MDSLAGLIKKRLGEILIDAGLIKGEDLDKALDIQRKTKGSLGQILVDMGLVDRDQVMKALSSQLGVSYISLSDYLIDPETITYVPRELAKKYMLVPIGKDGDKLIVAMAHPWDIKAIDHIRSITGMPVKTVIASEDEIKKIIDQYYEQSTGTTLEEMVKEIGEEYYEEEEVEVDRLREMAEETPVVKFVNLLLAKAIQERASDIHIEPRKDVVKVRYRIDGILRDMFDSTKELHPAVVSRIKILGGMNIAERRLPQDGRYVTKMGNKEVDLRISSLPTIFGEKIVIRLLNKSAAILTLEELGFSGEDYDKFKNLIKKPYGIILVTGPTGSGKTTSLYSAIQVLNTPERNIITVEDPVEYQIDGVNQVQVNPKIDLRFSTALRSILRQDPDIILIGEIRDLETARIAMQSAITGHLVLSTLHTNDAASALTRLVEMGVEPFMVASSVIGIIAQRLVRKICPRCKYEYEPTEDIRLEFQKVGLIKEGDTFKLAKGKGCSYCNNTGYRGRTVVGEILVLNSKIRAMVLERVSSDVIRDYAKKELGMATLKESAMRKVMEMVTSFDESLRVVS